MASIHLRIMGMNCGACAHRLEKVLRGVPGVTAASVSLMGESAAVEASTDGRTVHRLLEAVRAAGYDAEAMTSGHPQDRQLGSDSAPPSDRRAVFWAVGLAGVILSIHHLAPTETHQSTIHGLQAVLLVWLAAGRAVRPIFVSAARRLRQGSADMDVLIALGSGVAFLSSIYGALVVHDPAFVHLHAAAMILGLVCVGRYLEARARGQASALMLALAGRAPQTALVLRDGRLVVSPVESIALGEIVQIPTGQALPVDGEIIEGVAAVDESLMTGEPLPVRRGPGERVPAGALVREGVLTVRAVETAAASAVARIVQLVREAQHGRTEMQRLADRVAAVFTPLVLIVAVLTLAGWWLLGTAGSGGGVRAAVAVLVVACPCALGLATPTVVAVACGLAAARGILVRDAAMLEAMGRVQVVVWDKTGTLTQGAPTVRNVVTLPGWDGRDVLRLAAAAEQFSTHPAAKAIVAQARRQGLDLPPPSDFNAVPGGGVTATIERRRTVVGSLRFLEEQGIACAAVAAPAQRAAQAGELVAAVAIDGRAAGLILLADAVRPSAASAVDRLRRLGVESEMLTGDATAAAEQVAEVVGIRRCRSGVSPAGKVEHVRELQRRGERVAMVGDGVNDAAALAAAEVGVAFATGADVAREAAGINLIGSTPHLVADAVHLARAGVRIIRQNLFWAFVYNVLMIPLAAIGKLPPALAAGAMMLSSLTVVLNALRLPRAAGWPRRDSGSAGPETGVVRASPVLPSAGGSEKVGATSA